MNNKKTNFDSFFSNTEALAATGNLNEAKKQLSSLIDSSDLIKARAHNDSGVLAYRTGDTNEALRHYQQAVKLAPKEIVYRKNLADLHYFEFGDTQTALSHYRQILADNPRDFDANLSIGRICADLSRHFQAEAEDFFNLAEKIDPKNELVTGERAKFINEKFNAGTGKADKQRQQSKSITVSDNNNPEKIYADLSSKFKPNQSTETEKEILMFLDKYPDFALAHNDLGVISHKLNKPAQAGSCYREAVRLDPANSTFRKNLADFTFIIEKNPEEAMPHYHEALKNDPKDIEVLMMIGNICLSLGSPEEACNFFNLVLDIEPWNLDASRALEMVEANDNRAENDACS